MVRAFFRPRDPFNSGIRDSAFAADRDPLAPLGIAPPPLATPDPVAETCSARPLPIRIATSNRWEAKPSCGSQGTGRLHTTSIRFDRPARCAAAAHIRLRGPLRFRAGLWPPWGRAFYQERAPAPTSSTCAFAMRTVHARWLGHRHAARAQRRRHLRVSTISCRCPTARRLRSVSPREDRKKHRAFVDDAATGAQRADLSTAEYGATSWSADSNAYSRLKRPADGAAPTDKYLDSTLDAWNRRRFSAATAAAAQSSTRSKTRCSWSFPCDTRAVARGQRRAERNERMAGTT